MRFLPPRRFVMGGVIAAASLVLAGSVFAQDGLVVTDLQAPRGLSISGSEMLVAEQGAGRILRVTQFGSVGVVADGLPSAILESPEGNVATGVTSAINVGGTYFFTVGEAEEEGFDAVYSVRPGQEPELVADLLAFETANNVDGDVDQAGEPELLVNAYDLVSDGAGGLYVSGSGANAIFHVSAAGDISVFALFLNRDNPLFPNVGGPTMDQVPTGLEWGPDGALYVTTLTGFPFPNGEARVYRMEDLNGDGNALGDGETTIFASGLTTATNLAFDSDGSLLVTEFSTNMLEQAPGRLVRVVDGEISEVVAEPLVSPTGLTIFNGEPIVSQEFLGIVSEAMAGAAIASAGPPPADGEPGITPPSTGDAGLAETASSSALLLAAGLIGGLAVAGGTLAVRRR